MNLGGIVQKWKKASLGTNAFSFKEVHRTCKVLLDIPRVTMDLRP